MRKKQVRRRGTAARQGRPNREQPAARQLYEVRLSAKAEAVYNDLARRAEAGGERSAHATTLRMVDEVLDKIIPQGPINPWNALSGPLANIFRYKKGRARICWIASSVQRVDTVLFISESLRKEGDINDPYYVFTNMVMSGQFNELFEQMGVKVPRGAKNKPQTH